MIPSTAAQQKHSEIQEKHRMMLSRPQTKVWRSTRALNLNMAGQRAGKSQMIGIITGKYISFYPHLKGFIGANTYLQLTQSTLVKTTEIWRDLYGFTEYNSKYNPYGHYVIDKTPPAHFKRYESFKEYHNIISFWNGHIIYVGSLDNFKAHDGKEFAYAHLDETKDTREEAVTSVILARLSQRGLFINHANEVVYEPDYNNRAKVEGLHGFNPVWIHTSPAIGQVDWLVEMFNLADLEQDIRKRITATLPDGRPDFYYTELGNKSITIFSTYHNEENLPDNYIENRKAVLTENEQLKFIYGYPFSKTGGEYFPYFERIKHVNKVQQLENTPVHLTWDFNVMPYMTAIAVQIVFVDRYIDAAGGKHEQYSEGDTYLQVMQIRVYKEYCFETPNNTTQEICEAFARDNRETGTSIFYYGDASGRNRIPGMGSLTNFKMIETYLRGFIHNGSNRVGKTNINPLKRRDLLNRIFAGKYNNIEVIIDEGCTELIRDLEYLKLGADGKLKEKARDAATGATYEKIGHTSDAFEYLVSELLKNLITE